MNMPCSNTEALNEYHDRIDKAEIGAMRMKEELRDNCLLSASDLCYGETLNVSLNGETLNHAALIDSIINCDGLEAALIAIHKNDLLPLQELMMDCAKELVRLANE